MRRYSVGITSRFYAAEACLRAARIALECRDYAKAQRLVTVYRGLRAAGHYEPCDGALRTQAYAGRILCRV